MNRQTKATNPPLDPSCYKLDDQEAAFFKSMTGIQDDAELKEHILRVQAKAYSVRIGGVPSPRQAYLFCSSPQVYEYPCIRRFAFLK